MRNLISFGSGEKKQENMLTQSSKMNVSQTRNHSKQNYNRKLRSDFASFNVPTAMPKENAISTLSLLNNDIRPVHTKEYIVSKNSSKDLIKKENNNNRLVLAKNP